MDLTNKQKQFLKAQAHPLKPVVMLGGNGLTEGVMAEIELALEHHELIKVKVPEDDRDTRRAIQLTICEHTQAALIQSIGKVAIFYRPAQEPKLHLPRR